MVAMAMATATATATTYTASGLSPANMLANILDAEDVGGFGRVVSDENDWQVTLGISRRLDGTTSLGDPGAKAKNQIILYDDSGEPSDPKWNINYPGVHVEVWGAPSLKGVSSSITKGYSQTYVKAQEVNQCLLGAFPIDVTVPTTPESITRIVSIRIMGDITYLGLSDQERPIFTLNYDLITHPYWNPSPSPGDSQFGRRQVM